MAKLNVLILYDAYSNLTNCHYEYLSSFSLFSQHNIQYVHATHDAACTIDLEMFDVIIINYSIRTCQPLNQGCLQLSPAFIPALKKYQGYKVLFVQDEYDGTEYTRQFIEQLNIKLVYTCVPKQFVNTIYPHSRFPTVTFISVLTGYIADNHLKLHQYHKPFTQRQYAISYRARILASWYGDLCQEKMAIGKRMLAECERRNIPANIAWQDHQRIYGDAWYQFLANAKATLATESGCNVFDDRYEIRQSIQQELNVNPTISYAEIHAKYLAQHEGKVKMNQISPKIFEAIALKTALICYEGEYSGIIKPHIHYIPLKKDFSNVEEVLAKLDDHNYLEEITTQAYNDILLSEKYTYKKFIATIDNTLINNVATPKTINSLYEFDFLPINAKSNYQYNLKNLTALPMNKPLSPTDVTTYNAYFVDSHLQKYLRNTPQKSTTS